MSIPSSIIRYGNERWLVRVFLAVLFVVAGLGILYLSQWEFGADDGMITIIRVFGVVFILLGFHRALHYPISRVDPARKLVEVGYRWYFFDSLKSFSLDDFSKLRVIRGSLGAGTNSMKDRIVFAGKGSGPDIMVFRDINSKMVLRKARELAKAVKLPLVEEHAANNRKREIDLEGDDYE